MPAIRLVIFDLDGTLLDTLDDIAGAMNRVLEARGFPPHPTEAYKMLVGDGIDEAVRRAFTEAAHPFPDEEIAAIVRDYRREYAACWRLNSRPYPGIPELLGALPGRGIQAAVLSNKSHPFTEAMARELLPGHPFAAVRGALPGGPLKPDPAAALDIAAELGVPPASCLFLGDTKIDMMTAVAAGMVPVGALWGFRDEAELRTHGAAAVISAPLELLSLL